MKIKTKLLLLFATLFYSACTKDKFADDSVIRMQTFKGIVLDFSTNQSIPNANVNLYVHDGTDIIIEGGILINDYLTIDSIMSSKTLKYVTTSDSAGNYVFTVPIENPEASYRILAHKPGYARPFSGILGVFHYPAFQNADTLYLDIASVLKICFHHTQPFAGADSLSLSSVYDDGGMFPEHRRTISHQHIFTSNSVCTFIDSVSFKLGHVVRLEWGIYNNVIQAMGDSDTSLIEFGTTEHHVFY